MAEARLNEEDRVLEVAHETNLTPEAAAPVLGATGAIPQTERVASLGRRPGVTLSALFAAAGLGGQFSAEALATAGIELKYAGYIAREREAANRLAELAAFELPSDLPYLDLLGLATEARQKLDRVRPTSLAQAGRVPGVTPSDLHNLVVETLRWRRQVA